LLFVLEIKGRDRLNNGDKHPAGVCESFPALPWAAESRLQSSKRRMSLLSSTATHHPLWSDAWAGQPRRAD